jgi:hypothetical protein
VLGKALGGAMGGGSDGPSSAQSGSVWDEVDHSAWTVSYGSSGIVGSSGSSTPSLLMLAGIAAVAWYLVKKA